MSIVKIPIIDNEGPVLGSDCLVEYEGEVCPYVTIDSGIGKRLVGYEIIKRDLEDCLFILESIKNGVTNEQVLINALWESFITKYGRCFSVASRGRGIKLEAGDVTKYEGQKFETHHEWLINERNNFSAHAGDSDSDIFEARLALKPLSKGKQRLKFYIVRNLVISPKNDALNEHKELVSHVISVVDRKLDEIYVRIKQHYENIDIDNLYDAAKHIIT